MNDSEIIKLFFNRDENAIVKSNEKYGAYCMKIATNIAGNSLDGEECVSDAYMKAWNSIPPSIPTHLGAFLGKITRNLAINRYNASMAQKRCGSEFALSLDELDECIPDTVSDIESSIEENELSNHISSFLRSQNEFARRVFVCRYFSCDSVSDIAATFKCSEEKIKSSLFRTRKKLKSYLEKEGIAI